MSFETLLNALDGIQDSDGIFTVITTNCVEQLDPALGQPTNDDEMSTRPGRIDKVLRLDIMHEKERLQLARRILSGCPQHVDKMVIDGDGDTPAQFQDRCAQLALREYWRER